MGYSTKVYVGWMAICKMGKMPPEETIVTRHVCERCTEHKVNASQNYCSKCGGMVVTTEVKKTKQHYYPRAELEELDGFEFTPEEGEFLDKCFVIFPEFLETKYNYHSNTEIIMLPGYRRVQEGQLLDLTMCVDIGSNFGAVRSREIAADVLKRVFKYEDVQVVFGAISDVR